MLKVEKILRKNEDNKTIKIAESLAAVTHTHTHIVF